MEANQSNDSSNGYAMAAGDGPSSYTKNSSYQKAVANAAEILIQEAVEKKLAISDHIHINNFCVADLGCSTGPNTFFAVQNIIDAVELKYKNHASNSIVPEFHVYFNDHVSNDFNTLFRSLPVDRNYYAYGVPGSFHARLFPPASLHFVHSSYSLHWLSKLPEEITDNRDSAAWNKGRIHYAEAGKEVIEAYSNEYAMEMNLFLQARAREVVPGGLMAITVLARPDGVLHSQVNTNIVFEVLGSSLMDLAKIGKIDEEKVNSCNLPIYLVSPEELKTIINRNGSFTVEGMESLPRAAEIVDIHSIIDVTTTHIRAVTEALLTEYFGNEILDELFQLFLNKLKEPSLFQFEKELNLFVLLKRKSIYE